MLLLIDSLQIDSSTEGNDVIDSKDSMPNPGIVIIKNQTQDETGKSNIDYLKRSYLKNIVYSILKVLKMGLMARLL